MVFRHQITKHLGWPHRSGLLRIFQRDLAFIDLAFIHIEQLLRDTVEEVVGDHHQRLPQLPGLNHQSALR
ncbi:hypothetical protein D3C81_2290390 [compost metagenome]